VIQYTQCSFLAETLFFVSFQEEIGMNGKHVLVTVGGCDVRSFNRLSEETIKRLEYVLERWLTRKYSHLLLCGGITKPWEIQTKPEAVLMQEWLSLKGTAEGRVILEEQGTDIVGSLILAGQLMEKQCLGDAAITVVDYLPRSAQCQNVLQAHGCGLVRRSFVFDENMERTFPQSSASV
jgi:hypothetical protein